MSFYSIGKDVILDIFGSLKNKDMFNLLLTCKLFYNTLKDSENYQRYKIEREHQERFKDTLFYIGNQNKLCWKCKDIILTFEGNEYSYMDLEKIGRKIYKTYWSPGVGSCMQELDRLYINESQINETISLKIGGAIRYLCKRHFLSNDYNRPLYD